MTEHEQQVMEANLKCRHDRAVVKKEKEEKLKEDVDELKEAFPELAGVFAAIEDYQKNPPAEKDLAKGMCQLGLAGLSRKEKRELPFRP